MIQEDYVSFETAKLLKEKGFDIPCNAYFVEVEKETAKNKVNRRFYHSSVVANRNAYKSEMANHYYFSCPTLQMAMKWLREVHKCYITFSWEFKEYDKNYKPVFKDIVWSFNIAIPKYNSARQGDGSYFDLDSDKEYGCYEEACEEAIRYCLENLI